MAKRKPPPKRYRLICYGTAWYDAVCAACGDDIPNGKRVWAVLERNGTPIKEPKWSRYQKSICSECVDIVAELLGADVEEMAEP